MLNHSMQNGEALYHAMEAVTDRIRLSGTDTEELTETLELLHQMKKEEELRRDRNLGSSVEEELYDIFAELQELHFAQGKIWALSIPAWKTVRNALYLRTGVCLSKGMIISRYYDFCREQNDAYSEGESITGNNVLAGLETLYKEIRNVRG